MTLTIELDADDAARLANAAQIRGIGPEEFAKKLVTERLPSAVSVTPDAENRALIDLLHSWTEEDATDDAEVLAKRDSETTDLIRNIEANRFTLGVPE